MAREADAPGVETDPDAFALENLLHGLRHVLVFAADHAIGHLHDRDLAAEPPERLAELEPDVAAADHDQVLGQQVEVEDRGVGEVVDGVEARHRRDQRAAADVDEDPIGREPIVADADFVRADEARVALIDGAVREPAQPGLDAFARLSRDLVLPRLDPLHVDANRAGLDPNSAPRRASCAA